MKDTIKNRYIQAMKLKNPEWDSCKVDYEYEMAKHILLKGIFAVTILLIGIGFLIFK